MMALPSPRGSAATFTVTATTRATPPASRKPTTSRGRAVGLTRCDAFFREPRAHDIIDQRCLASGLTRRTFTRTFLQGTGLSFVAWRQRACLVNALPRLAPGVSVTSVAMALGYDDPAAVTCMFNRLLGASPRGYLALP